MKHWIVFGVQFCCPGLDLLSDPRLSEAAFKAIRGASFALFWQTRAKLHNASYYANNVGSLFAPRYPQKLHYIKWHSFCWAHPASRHSRFKLLPLFNHIDSSISTPMASMKLTIGYNLFIFNMLQEILLTVLKSIFPLKAACSKGLEGVTGQTVLLVN